jgi:hypothetical protein
MGNRPGSSVEYILARTKCAQRTHVGLCGGDDI